jgi:periplasmic protein TonB
MSAYADRRRDSLAPALLAAAALHLGLFAALTLFHPTLPLPLGSAVPINIVSQAPTTDSRQADQAPETQTAQADQPVPQAKAPVPPPPPPPQPQQRVTPPKPLKTVTLPQPALKPAPTPAKPTPVPAVKPQPAPTKPSRTPTKDTFDLNAIAAVVAHAARTAPQRPAYAARGPTRTETAPVARVDAGEGVSQSDLQGLQQLLERLWNPDCVTEGGGAVVVPIHFTVGDDGRVTGRVTDAAHDTPADTVAYAAARRAIDAVHEAEPYADAYRGKTFTVNFDAHKACAGR